MLRKILFVLGLSLVLGACSNSHQENLNLKVSKSGNKTSWEYDATSKTTISNFEVK